jgi:anti-sigma factor ChrR (cupin superfamily)
MKIDTKKMVWEKIKGRGGTLLKKLHRDEKRNFQIDLMKLDPNFSFAIHTHPDIEWVYVLKGNFTDHRGKFKEGDFVLNEAGSTHQAKTGKEGAELVVCWCGRVTYEK